MTNSKNNIEIIPLINDFWKTRDESILTVLSGLNNSGKTLILKHLKEKIGVATYLIGVNRFYHVHHLGNAAKIPDELSQLHRQFSQNFSQDDQNHEQNFLNLNRIIQNLNDDERNKLFEMCELLLGCTFQLKKAEESNELSMRYIDIDGQYLSLSSSGTRLLMTILGLCMDKRFETILIDEPELGLSPKIQHVFSNFLQDNTKRSEYFPHLKHVVIATHSHLFLDRTCIENNFSIKKIDNKISIEAIESINDFHSLQFNLLGNSFETMFFPSAIVIVEGKSDCEYIEKILSFKFPDKRISVTSVQGDGNMTNKIHSIKELVGNLDESPFKNRLFVVLDARHSNGIKSKLILQGVLEDNIIIWDKNGIEYYYPSEILAKLFRADEETVINSIKIKDDAICFNGISKTKDGLKEEILKQLSATSKIPEEFENKLIKPIDTAIA